MPWADAGGMFERGGRISDQQKFCLLVQCVE